MQGEYYRVGDEKFLNFYPAVKRSSETGHFAEYVIPEWHMSAYESVDVLDVLSKPAEHWIDAKLDWLFETKKNTQLLYSGGTDSHTMLMRALSRGHKFDRAIALMKGVTDIEQVDLDCYPGAYFLRDNPDVAREALVHQLSIEEYEVWKEEKVYLTVCDFHFCFYPSWKSRMRFPWDRTCPTVNGHAKPTLYKKPNGDVYWYRLDTDVDFTYFDWHTDFYIDGYVPELAVHQAYLVKQWFEENDPDHTGYMGLLSVPFDRRGEYHAHLGRLPALTKTIEIGTHVGKSDGLSQKHINAMQQVINLGRMDILEGWDQNRRDCIADLKNAPHGIEIRSMLPAKGWNNGQPIDMPKPVRRIGYAYKLHPDGIERVSTDSVFN